MDFTDILLLSAVKTGLELRSLEQEAHAIYLAFTSKMIKSY